MTEEHTIEPEIGTIEEDAGELIGQYRAKCAYCGRTITGDDDNAWHWEPDR